jgi:hypothetical protein
MKTRKHTILPLAALAGLAIALPAQSAVIVHTVANAGFDTSGGSDWTDNGGTLYTGTNPNGWSSTYFLGGHPTDSTFGAQGTGVKRQDLTGADSTYVLGRTYTLTVDAFSAALWGLSVDSNIVWTLGLAADGTTVAADNWGSDGYTGTTSHALILVDATSNGLTTLTLEYTATAADVGKTIGIQLLGLVGEDGNGNDTYAFIDNVQLESVPEPSSMALLGLGGLALILRRRK